MYRELIRRKLLSIIKENRIKSIFILMIIPLLAVVVYGIRYNQNVINIFLPNALSNSSWNDELIYYKTIEGILQYGKPQGYFGYNESHALVGNLGAWSPFIYLFDLLWGRIINWNYNAPIVARIVFAIFGFAVYGVCRKPSNKDCFFIGLFVMSFSLFARYMVSNMADHYFTILLIILISLIYNKQFGRKTDDILVSSIIILLSLMRPYMVIMWLIYMEMNHNCFRKIMKQVLLAMMSIIVYFASSYFMTASYFIPLIKTAWIQLIFSNPILGIKNVIEIILEGCKSTFDYSKAAFVYGDSIGLQYVIFIAFTAIFFLLSLKKDYIRFRWISWMMINILLWFAIVLLYDFGVGSRHIMPFIVAEGILLIEELKTHWKMSIIILVAYLCIVKFQEPNMVTLPQYSERMEKTIADVNSQMTDCNSLKESDAWANTLIWVFSDSEGLFSWQTLYGIPAGMGINICTGDYVISNFNSLSARYIACNVHGEISELCILNNFDEIYINNYYNVAIYKRY